MNISRGLSSVLLAFVIGGCQSAKENMVNTSQSNPAKGFVEVFIPPKDLNAAIIDANCNVCSTGLLKQYIAFRYSGIYSLDLITDKPCDLKCVHNTKLDARLEIYSGDKLVFSRSSQRPYGLNYDETRQAFGISLLDFRCPDEVPLKQQFTAIFMITAADPNMAAVCGKTRVVLHRLSNQGRGPQPYSTSMF